MGSYSIIRVILSGVIAIVIGVVLTAVLNLVRPADNIMPMLIVVCLAALFSAFSGYLLGARQKK
jgi:chromate transport protein ChrA